ncbi:MAG: hypothetical protein ACXQT4_02845 [Methanotrichaceae archaeon]
MSRGGRRSSGEEVQHNIERPNNRPHILREVYIIKIAFIGQLHEEVWGNVYLHDLTGRMPISLWEIATLVVRGMPY